MKVVGYETGPIEVSGAYTSDIELPAYVTPGSLCTIVEADRPGIVTMPGMRHKYLPVRHDPATGLLSAGGRYLFRTYDDAVNFGNHLETHAMPGESLPFWQRPIFIDPVRFAWRVHGAHDFIPICEHDINRLERYAVQSDAAEARLPAIYPEIQAAARALQLAHVTVMYQPEHRLIGVLTAATCPDRAARTQESLRCCIDKVIERGSASEAALRALKVRKVFDRTSLNLTIYLPLSEKAGGAAAIWPNSPPIPLPGVEPPPMPPRGAAVK